MEFHPNKCKVLSVRGKRKKVERFYSLHDVTLENVAHTKYLGVTLQCDGAWDIHISDVVKRGNRLLGFLKRNVRVKSKSIKARAYKTLLRSVLEYVSVIWDPHTESGIRDIERIQRPTAPTHLHQKRIQG